MSANPVPGTTTPGPLLQRALDFINANLQAFDEEIQKRGLAGSTAIIVSAKHGQSPQDPNELTRIKDGPIIEAINAAWKASHPTAGNVIVAGVDDSFSAGIAISRWPAERLRSRLTRRSAMSRLWSRACCNATSSLPTTSMVPSTIICGV